MRNKAIPIGTKNMVGIQGYGVGVKDEGKVWACKP